MPGLTDLEPNVLLAIAMGTALVVLLLPKLLQSYRGRLGQAASHVLIWVTVFAGLIAGYAFRNELETVAGRVAAELTAAGEPVALATQDGERAVRIRRSSRGPFIARARVNGADIPMLVDTGATSVVLKAADAERAGIDLKSLSFSVAVDTANGSTFCAPVRLRQIAIGGIAYTSVEALVAQPGNLKESLLGMSFLKRLRSYDFAGDFLTLRS
jgi:aspartyl protease family protein